ncbi:MAG TPA: trehalase family glycosidase [Bacteriovoracaceae bacterium]|nr:trehalase family glycosidase [Bacteriovoracaceae bacterium]
MKKITKRFTKVILALSFLLMTGGSFAQAVWINYTPSGDIKLDWDDYIKVLEPKFKEASPNLSDLKFAIVMNGSDLSGATELSWKTRQFVLPAPYDQVDFFLEVRNKQKKTIHRSHLILREVHDGQIVAPESFTNLVTNFPFKFKLPKSLKKSTGYRGILSDVSYDLGYKKISWVLKSDADPEIRALLEKLQGKFNIQIKMDDEGTPKSVLIKSKPGDQVLAEVAPKNFYFKVDAAFSGNSFFWDDMLVSLATISHHPWLVRSTMQFWLDVQEANAGLIPREVRKANLKSLWFHDMIEIGRPTRPNLELINPYLMDWVAEELYTFEPSKENLQILKKVAKSIEDYTVWMKENRSVYGSDGRWLGFVISALGSGLDDSRGRRGDYYTPEAYHSAWVDLLAQHISMQKHLVTWYGRFLEEGTASTALKKEWTARKQAAWREVAEKEKLLNELYWNEKEAFYFDLIPDGNGGHKQDTAYFTIGGFWPLYSGSSTPEQVKKMIKTQFTPEHFGGRFPFPANSRHAIPREDLENDGYWAKWSHWPSMAAVIMEGLHQYGEHKLASELTFQFLRGMEEASTTTIAEFYGEYFDGDVLRSRIGRHGSHITRLDFAGWSKVPPLYMLLKYGLGFKPQVDGTVLWNPEFELAPGEKLEVSNLMIHGKRINLGLLKNGEGVYVFKGLE